MDIEQISEEVWAILLELRNLPEWSYPILVPELSERAREVIIKMDKLEDEDTYGCS